ncbi:claspin-like [Drosophila kikkawai]|uniref:Claspin-like n=1 Tax=Drosophila kikkawai TaxID=30033 RepID=A0A6P4J2J7_DROKI
MDDVDEIQAEPKGQPEELANQPMAEDALAEEPLASTSTAAGGREIPLQGDQTSPAKVRLVTNVVELLKDLKAFVNLMEAMEFLKSDSESEEEEESAPEHSGEEGNPGVMDDVDEIQDQASFKMQEYFMTLTKKRMEKLRKMQKEKDSFRIHTKMQEYFMTLTTKRMEKLHKMQKEEDSFRIHTKMQEYFMTLTKKRIEKLRKMQKEEEQKGLADEDDMDVDENKEYDPENNHGHF